MIAGWDAQAFVSATLAEDLGDGGDVTSAACVPAALVVEGRFVAREPLVAAGLWLLPLFIHALDRDAEIVPLAAEGERAGPGATLATVRAHARALLSVERSALNTLQHLSGVATLTRSYVERLAGTGATLLDTRKTTPGLRVLEKWAVGIGGGTNHRHRLDDMAMVKDNHVAAAGGIGPAVAACRRAGLAEVIAEVDRLDQIEEALAAGATRLLLDNMAPTMLRQAVAMVAGRVPTEASGGVTLETIADIGATGVDYVSVGRITQSAPAVDIGLDIDMAEIAPAPP